MGVSIEAEKTSPYIFKPTDQTGVSYQDLIEKHLPIGEDVHDACPVSGTEEDGFSAVYRNKATGAVKLALNEDLTTYYALFSASAKAFAERPCLAWRPYDFKQKKSEPYYVEISFQETQRRAQAFGAGILHLLQHSPFKLDTEPHAKIDAHDSNYRSYGVDDLSFVLTLYLANRAEWVITDLACSHYSITNTVLYDTLGANTSEYILELVESPVVVTSYSHIETVLELKRKNPQQLANLIAVVSMDPLGCVLESSGHRLVERARELNIELYDFDQVLGVGEIFPRPTLPPLPSSVYTISFTSGTTGLAPKGVVLTHENAALGITFVLTVAPPILNDRELAFLPLAHIFQRQATAFTLVRGGLLGFPQLNYTPLTLVEDLKLFKPKHMANVPRVYTKFESVLRNATVNASLPLKSLLTKHIFATKDARASVKDSAGGAHWIYDRTIIPKIRAQLGFDNMMFAITGSAPISAETIRFLKALLNIGLSQGFGLTETFAGFSFSNAFEASPGLCGSTGVCCEVRVRELPELGYHLTDPKGPSGELQIRGLQIFHHYFKNPGETEKSLSGGWFSTGDVARIDAKTGRLFIVDRVKNFFKLAQGEYVTPEKIENTYLSSNPLLTQCFVHGDSLKPHLVAVIGVDPERIVSFLKHLLKVPLSQLQSEEAILARANELENRSKLLHHLTKNVKGLLGFEMIRNVYIEFEPLRIDRDVITPTVKIKRPIAAKYFSSQIAAMYEEPSLLERVKL